MPTYDVEAVVKKVIEVVKNRGCVTVDELNGILPSDLTSSEQIEDIMARLNDVGIDIVESHEVDGTEEGGG